MTRSLDSLLRRTKLKRIMGTSPAYRMSTPYEIELLRKSKREIDQVVGEVLAAKKDASQS